jgi:hypothetical protein
MPLSLLSVAEAMVLGRLRWQIELLIKLWKSHGRIDESRSAKPWHILCDVYAKLLAMLVQHWLLLVAAWRYADRSLSKAAKVVQTHVRDLEVHFADASALVHSLGRLVHLLSRGARINKSEHDPRAFQLLQGLEPIPERLIVVYCSYDKTYTWTRGQSISCAHEATQDPVHPDNLGDTG